jgi:hypothetical protein
MEGVATVAAFELPASFDDSTLRSASTTVSIALALAHYVRNHRVLYSISEMTLLLLILLKVLRYATYYITRKGLKCSSQHARRRPGH